ncbi:hypothetical protein [Rufibacter latericius]|nr:hypothetical protein [Rufibacter latericius]
MKRLFLFLMLAAFSGCSSDDEDEKSLTVEGTKALLQENGEKSQ